MPKKREVDYTHYTLLDKYFEALQRCPLPIAEQALMAHILNFCNKNASNEFKMRLDALSANAGIDIRTTLKALSTLCLTGYICIDCSGIDEEEFPARELLPQNCRTLATKSLHICCIFVNENASEIATYLRQKCCKLSDVMPFFATQEEEIRKRKEEEEFKMMINFFELLKGVVLTGQVPFSVLKDQILRIVHDSWKNDID